MTAFDAISQKVSPDAPCTIGLRLAIAPHSRQSDEYTNQKLDANDIELAQSCFTIMASVFGESVASVSHEYVARSVGPTPLYCNRGIVRWPIAVLAAFELQLTRSEAAELYIFSKCVPRSLGSSTTLPIHSEARRAYWWVFILRSGPRWPVTRTGQTVFRWPSDSRPPPARSVQSVQT